VLGADSHCYGTARTSYSATRIEGNLWIFVTGTGTKPPARYRSSFALQQPLTARSMRRPDGVAELFRVGG
jgi:hypothetical protein